MFRSNAPTHVEAVDEGRIAEAVEEHATLMREVRDQFNELLMLKSLISARREREAAAEPQDDKQARRAAAQAAIDALPIAPAPKDVAGALRLFSAHQRYGKDAKGEEAPARRGVPVEELKSVMASRLRSTPKRKPAGAGHARPPPLMYARYLFSSVLLPSYPPPHVTPALITLSLEWAFPLFRALPLTCRDSRSHCRCVAPTRNRDVIDDSVSTARGPFALASPIQARVAPPVVPSFSSAATQANRRMRSPRVATTSYPSLYGRAGEEVACDPRWYAPGYDYALDGDAEEYQAGPGGSPLGDDDESGYVAGGWLSPPGRRVVAPLPSAWDKDPFDGAAAPIEIVVRDGDSRVTGPPRVRRLSAVTPHHVGLPPVEGFLIKCNKNGRFWKRRYDS